MDAKQRIARRVAQELRDGDIVNLGIGLPTMVANYLPEGIHITLQIGKRLPRFRPGHDSASRSGERWRATVRCFTRCSHV